MAQLWGFLIGIGAAIASATAISATITVGRDGGADLTDIQSALDAALDGDTVLVGPGEYVIDQPLDFNRLHKEDDPTSPPVKNLSLRSEKGPKVTILRISGKR